MRRNTIGILVVLIGVVATIWFTGVAPHSRLEAATQTTTALRGIGSQYDLSSDAPTRAVTGRLVSRVLASAGKTSDRGLSGAVTLSGYANGRWTTLAITKTGAGGTFTFVLSRCGGTRVSYAGSASCKPASTQFDVYVDDLRASKPTLAVSYDESGGAFVVMRATVVAPDVAAYASDTGDNGVLQFMLTPVTSAIAAYNGPYAEGTQVVTRNGEYAWGCTVPKAQLAAGTQWRVVTFFQAGQYYRAYVRDDTFTIAPATAK
jgi:hypothetical protein